VIASRTPASANSGTATAGRGALGGASGRRWSRAGGIDRAGLLAEQGGGQRCKSPLPGYHPPGPPFRPEGQVDIFQFGHGVGGEQPTLEVFAEGALFLQGIDDRLAALVALAQALQLVPDGGYGHLVKRTGRLFAVPGDKGDGGALRQEVGGGLHLPAVKLEEACYGLESVVLFIHGFIRAGWNEGIIALPGRWSAPHRWAGSGDRRKAAGYASGLGSGWQSEEDGSAGAG